MDLYLASIGLLAASAVFTGVLAIASMLGPARQSQSRRANFMGAGLAALACLLGLAGAVAGPWAFDAEPQTASLPWGLPFGSFRLMLDPLSRIFLLPVFGLGLVCSLSGALALRHERAREHNLASHWFFYLMLLLGMATVICAHDAALFLLAWEVMSLAPFFLIDFNDRDSKVRDAAWTYLTAAHLGAVFLIAFFVLLWQTAGHTALSPLPDSAHMLSARPGLAAALFILALIGFGAKAGMAPLHVWLPEAHPAAPSHVSALLSGAMINVGLYGIIRAISILSGGTGGAAGMIGNAPAWWGWTLVGIGICSALIGILKALAQGNLKRLLAYSSVENMGLMFAGLGAGLVGQACGDAWIAILGFSGSLLHMLNHAGFKGLLFLCAGEVLHAAGTVHMELLGGLGRRMPAVGCAFAIGAASIACLPPFSGFAGEFAICLALLDGPSVPGVERQLGLLLSLAFVGLVSGLACAVYVKAYGITFLGRPRSSFAANAAPAGWKTAWPLLVPALACVGGGLFAPLFFDLAANAALCGAPAPKGLISGCLDAWHKASGCFAHVSIYGWAAIALVLFFWGMRKVALAGRLERGRVWGCGYQADSARIQYTDASFAEPLARIFGPVMGIELHGEAVRGFFPGHSSLGITAPDRARTLIFAPLFEAFERLCNACKIIQHGKIHLYILYILATVVALLIWGLWP